MNTLTSAHTLRHIAVTLPGATAVMRRHKLDFCCGGQQTLDEAVRAKGLDANVLLGELAGLAPAANDAQAQTPGELIDHILARYHDVHRRELPELLRMATRLEAVHREHPEVPHGLAALLQDMQTDLLDHMLKEEQILFPLMRSGARHFLPQPITVMRSEHDHHGQTLARMLALTRDMTPPVDACTTWRALYLGLSKLQADLMQHIHLENNVLFVQFEPQATQAI